MDGDVSRNDPGSGGAEHGGVWIPPDAGRVLADDGVGEGVVGRHAHLIQQPVDERSLVAFRAEVARERIEDVSAHGIARGPRRCALDPREFGGLDDRVQVRQEPAPAELVEVRESGGDALGEFPGGFPCEGQPEDLVGADVTVRDEPQHACRHRRGLAAAGTRDDERGLERRFDHGTLPRRRRERADRTHDDIGGKRQRGGGHALTAPIVWMRQIGDRRESSQWASTDAEKLAADIPRAAPMTRSRYSSRARCGAPVSSPSSTRW